MVVQVREKSLTKFKTEHFYSPTSSQVTKPHTKQSWHASEQCWVKHKPDGTDLGTVNWLGTRLVGEATLCVGTCCFPRKFSTRDNQAHRNLQWPNQFPWQRGMPAKIRPLHVLSLKVQGSHATLLCGLQQAWTSSRGHPSLPSQERSLPAHGVGTELSVLHREAGDRRPDLAASVAEQTGCTAEELVTTLLIIHCLAF